MILGRNSILIVVSLIVIPLFWLWLFRKLGILEHKKWAQFYKRKPVPTAQGIRMWLTLIVVIALLGRHYLSHEYMLIYLASITLLGLIATIDLFYPLPSRLRLLFQVIIFWLVVIYGDISITTIRIVGWDIHIGEILTIVGTIARFWLCTNAINRFDGIEGQASGVTAIGSFTLLAVVSIVVFPSYGYHLTPEITDQLVITQIIALSLGLVALVYTIIEYKPLGLIRDIGTTIFWFSLAYLALLGGAKVGTLVVVLSLVLFDSVRVVINRLVVMKKNPLQGDYTHLHHRFLANGRSRSEVRWFVWIWAIFLAVLMLLQKTSSINKRIILIMMAILFFGVNIYLFWIKKRPTMMKIEFKTDEVNKL